MLFDRHFNFRQLMLQYENLIYNRMEKQTLFKTIEFLLSETLEKLQKINKSQPVTIVFGDCGKGRTTISAHLNIQSFRKHSKKINSQLFEENNSNKMKSSHIRSQNVGRNNMKTDLVFDLVGLLFDGNIQQSIELNFCLQKINQLCKKIKLMIVIDQVYLTNKVQNVAEMFKKMKLKFCDLSNLEIIIVVKNATKSETDLLTELKAILIDNPLIKEPESQFFNQFLGKAIINKQTNLQNKTKQQLKFNSNDKQYQTNEALLKYFYLKEYNSYQLVQINNKIHEFVQLKQQNLNSVGIQKALALIRSKNIFSLLDLLQNINGYNYKLRKLRKSLIIMEYFQNYYPSNCTFIEDMLVNFEYHINQQVKQRKSANLSSNNSMEISNKTIDSQLNEKAPYPTFGNIEIQNNNTQQKSNNTHKRYQSDQIYQHNQIHKSSKKLFQKVKQYRFKINEQMKENERNSQSSRQSNRRSSIDKNYLLCNNDILGYENKDMLKQNLIKNTIDYYIKDLDTTNQQIQTILQKFKDIKKDNPLEYKRKQRIQRARIFPLRH